MPRARRCADGEYPRCRVVVYRVIGYVLSAVNKLTKQEVRVEREIRARYAELMGVYDDRYVFPFSHFCVFREDGAVVEVGDVTYMSVRVGALGDNVRWVGSDGTTWSDDSLTECVFASGERVPVLKDL